VKYWEDIKRRNSEGELVSFFPYDTSKAFPRPRDSQALSAIIFPIVFIGMATDKAGEEGLTITKTKGEIYSILAQMSQRFVFFDSAHYRFAGKNIATLEELAKYLENLISEVNYWLIHETEAHIERPLMLSRASLERILAVVRSEIQKEQEAEKTVRLVLSYSERDFPWLPSERQIMEVAGQEKAVIIKGMRQDHRIFRVIKDIDPELGSLMMIPGASTLRFRHFVDLAKQAGVSLGELRRRFEIPQWTESLVTVTYDSDMMQRFPRRLLLEELFHVLAGNLESDQRWNDRLYNVDEA
jgi:hypothetical protein